MEAEVAACHRLGAALPHTAGGPDWASVMRNRPHRGVENKVGAGDSRIPLHAGPLCTAGPLCMRAMVYVYLPLYIHTLQIHCNTLYIRIPSARYMYFWFWNPLPLVA